MKPFQIYLAMLIIIELILSVYIAHGQYINEILCIGGKGCALVQSSDYGEFLGVKTSVWGVIAFTFLFIFYGWAHNSYKRYRFFLAATLLGSLASVRFLAIQAFILKTYCTSCLIADFLMLVIAVLSYVEFCKLRKYY